MDNKKPGKGEEPRLKQALDRAVQWLLERQNVEGWWCGELETNVTMTAEHVLLLHFLAAFAPDPGICLASGCNHRGLYSPVPAVFSV